MYVVKLETKTNLHLDRTAKLVEPKALASLDDFNEVEE